MIVGTPLLKRRVKVYKVQRNLTEPYPNAKVLYLVERLPTERPIYLRVYNSKMLTSLLLVFVIGSFILVGFVARYHCTGNARGCGN